MNRLSFLKRYAYFFSGSLASVVIISTVYAVATIPVGCETPGDCDLISPTFQAVTLETDLLLADDDASNTITITAPANVGANYSLTLPADDGTNGQKLVTDGNGVLSWVTDSTTSTTLAKLHVPVGSDFTTVSANNAFQKVALGAAVKDSEGGWSNVDDAYTIAQDGDYWIDFNASWNNNGSSSNDPLDVAVRVNGVTALQTRHDLSDQISSGGFMVQGVSGMLPDLSIGDEITIELYDADDVIIIKGTDSHLSLYQLPDTAGVGIGGGSTTFEALTDTDTTGIATGALVYYDGTNWVDLPSGTAGQTLVMNAGATAPEWATTDTSSTALSRIQVSPTTSINDNALTHYSFDEVAFVQGTDLSLNASGAVDGLQAGKTYRITANINNPGVAPGAGDYRMVDLTADATLGETLSIASNSDSGNQESKSIQTVFFTPTVTTSVGIDYVSGAIGEISAQSNLTVEEVPSTTVIAAQDTPTNDQATSGYVDIGNMRIQWGIESFLVGETGTSKTVTLPVAFADTNYSVASTLEPGLTFSGTPGLNRLTAKTASTFDMFIPQQISNAGSFSWQVIGVKP